MPWDNLVQYLAEKQKQRDAMAGAPMPSIAPSPEAADQFVKGFKKALGGSEQAVPPPQPAPSPASQPPLMSYPGLRSLLFGAPKKDEGDES